MSQSQPAIPAPGAVAVPAKSLAHLPLPLFAAPMGIGGLGLAWREAGHALGAPTAIGEALLALTAALWSLIALLHVVRASRHPGAWAADLKHPIRSAFAGAISIGLMIVAGALIPYAADMAATVWLLAVALHLIIAVGTVRGMLVAPREAATLAPPLLLPLVGNIVAPVVGVKLGFVALSWMMFGIGGLLWIMIQPLILARVVSGPTLPEKLRPTLAIMLAPPAVGTVALVQLTGGFGAAPLAVFGLAAFMAAVLLTLTPAFARVPFAMSWWAWTFPSAAFAIAALLFAQAWPTPWGGVACWIVLLAVSAVVAIVSTATLRAALAGHLLAPEG